jgi:2-polyprenyl-3-methyl-5-hydroxy-6-metoxy-1,4-benzoquinol methylase
MIEQAQMITHEIVFNDETKEYTRLYIEHGEWWLDYLRATDEKINTTRVLKGILGERISKSVNSFRIIDVGAGEGTPTLSLLSEMNVDIKNISIDFLEPSPLLRLCLETNKEKQKLERLNSKTIPTVFQLCYRDEQYDLVLAINSLCGFVDHEFTHLQRLLAMKKPKGLCVIIMQSREGQYKKLQESINRGKYSFPMLDAEELAKRLFQMDVNYYDQEFESKVKIDLPRGNNIDDYGVLNLLVKKSFRLLNDYEKESILQLIQQTIDYRGCISVVNKVFVIE